MAFNLMLIPKEPIEWQEISKSYNVTDKSFEIFPITDFNGGDAIGVNIPFVHLTKASWKSTSDFITAISKSTPLDTVDLYSGTTIDVATFTPSGMQE